MPEPHLIAVAFRMNMPYPYIHEVFAGVQRYAREVGTWKCVIDEQPAKSIQSDLPLRRQYDGVIARSSLPMQQALATAGLPLVNTMYLTSGPTVPGVYVDTDAAGRLAAEHLIERGFRRLAFMGIDNVPQGQAIGRAFAQVAEEHGRACMVDAFHPGSHENPDYWSAASNHLEPFLDKLTPPVGVLTIFPWLARLCVTLCENRGWHIPQDVAMICVDNVKTVLELPPQITCIDLNYDQVGYEAGALLSRLLTVTESGAPQITVPPKGIITRESTDHYAVEDETVARALRFISENLKGKLSVEHVARHVALSPRSLQRRFDAALGRPISDEIRRLRLEMAKRLLRDGHLQIAQVADAAGFSSYIVMNRIFNRELGMSPTDYRDQQGDRGQNAR